MRRLWGRVSSKEDFSSASTVFICCASKDRKAGRRVARALEAYGLGISDRQTVKNEDPIWGETPLFQSIRLSRAFVLVLTPAFVHSNVCQAELDYADTHGRAIFVLARKRVAPDRVPLPLHGSTWLPFSNDEEVERVVIALVEQIRRLSSHPSS